MHRTSIWKYIEASAARNLLIKKLQKDRQIRFASSLPDTSNSKAGDDVETLLPLSPEPWPTDVVVDPCLVDHVTGTSSDGPVGAAVSLIDGLQSTTGLPWWATLSVTALGVRAALFPLALRQVQASASLGFLLQQAQRGLSVDGSDAPSSTKQRIQTALQRLTTLREQHSIAHPFWIVAAPVTQIPLFMTAVMAVRRMSASDWPGFHTGGLFWFTDLCRPALDLAAVNAPLGSWGIVLPAGVALAMLANIQRSFGSTHSSQGNAVMRWVMGNVKLLLQWVTVPLFIIALQLPQGAVLYWLASSLTALAQGHVLQMPAVKAAMGLLSGPFKAAPIAGAETMSEQTAQTQQVPQSVSASGQTSEGTANGQPTSAIGNLPRGQPVDMKKLLTVSPAVQAMAARATDASTVIVKAAELRAEGALGASQHCLQRVLELEPNNAPGHFAMGQNHAALREWPLAEQAFLTAAGLHQDEHQQARCWFGAGISQQMQAEHDAALQSLTAAETLSAALLLASGNSQATAAPQNPSSGRKQKLTSMMQQHDTVSGPRKLDAVRGLAVKAALARASILKQMKRIDEANECMQTAKNLDPAVGKYVKD
ncbi:hypothetical protein WJX77_009280 [Trebouxia sp. C0004]